MKATIFIVKIASLPDASLLASGAFIRQLDCRAQSSSFGLKSSGAVWSFLTFFGLGLEPLLHTKRRRPSHEFPLAG